MLETRLASMLKEAEVCTIKGLCNVLGQLFVKPLCVETGTTYVGSGDDLVHTTTNNLADMCRRTGGRLISFDIDEQHQEFARKLCGGGPVEFVSGDSVERMYSYPFESTDGIDILCLDSKEFDPDHMVKEFSAVHTHLKKSHVVLSDDIHNPNSVKWVKMVPELKRLGYHYTELHTPTGMFVAWVG